MKIHKIITLALLCSIISSLNAGAGKQKKLTDLVNPLLGTATLWDAAYLGYERHLKSRTWGAEVFPVATHPNAMVQLTPVTMWGAGAGYQYEDSTIPGFAHTAMGHWNYIDLPILPVSGEVCPTDYTSPFSHKEESAHPGYYQVRLPRYGVNAELMSTPRAGYHRYSYDPGHENRLLVNITHNQHKISDCQIDTVGPNAFAGRQGGEFFFYAVANHPIDSIAIRQGKRLPSQ